MENQQSLNVQLFLANAQPEEVIAFLECYLKVYKKLGEEKLKCLNAIPLLTSFEKDQLAYEALVLYSKRNKKTAEVGKHDQRRDGGTYGLDSLAKAYMCCPEDVEDYNAGLLIHSHIEEFGGCYHFTRKGIDKQSKMIDHFLYRIQNEADLWAALCRINGQKFLLKIEDENNLVKQLREEARIEESNKPQGDIVEARKEAYKSYYKLNNALKFFVDSNPNDECIQSVAREINEIVEDFNANIRARQTKLESKKNNQDPDGGQQNGTSPEESPSDGDSLDNGRS